ncbi:hypothetical protein G6F24_016758 [Rhizopus arrhizus]|nr:hypothetical protein G6F24_016758 [Rhizopus arrhizus]
MPQTTLLASSCTSVGAPAWRISSRPRAPSSPMPHVHRWLVPVHRRAVVDPATPARTVTDDAQVLAARGQVGMPGQHRFAVAGLAHGHRRVPVQALGELRAATGRQVLGHHHGRRVCGQAFQHHAQGFGATGG